MVDDGCVEDFVTLSSKKKLTHGCEKTYNKENRAAA